MAKINIISSTLKKELGETKIWTINFTHETPDTKVGEVISKTQPTNGEADAESIEWQQQYNVWKVKLARKSGNGGGGFKGKSPEERMEMARMNALNHATKLVCEHPEVKEQLKNRSVRDAVFTLAEQFATYITTGQRPVNQ